MRRTTLLGQETLPPDTPILSGKGGEKVKRGWWDRKSEEEKARLELWLSILGVIFHTITMVSLILMVLFRR